MAGIRGRLRWIRAAINDLKYYRNWADEIRTLSGAMKHIETKAQMIRLAEDYEKLAERAAQRANGEVPADR
jgi:hypothetical protein